MKILSSVMERGGFLAPQQFQQQTRWDAYVADVVAHMSLSSPWASSARSLMKSAPTVSLFESR